MPEVQELLNIAILAAIDAGKATLKHFGKVIQIKNKSDFSPVTIADLEANSIIEKYLQPLQIPIISEENKTIPFSTRQNWERFWLIDPLDGTKEFVNSSEEYTINIALIVKNKPVMGIIYLPVKDIIYFGIENKGSYMLNCTSAINFDEIFAINKLIKLPIATNYRMPVVVASRSHMNSETLDFIKGFEIQNGQVTIENYGSSLKLCMIAEGRADIYPRLGPTMEWDIAAAHAIIEASGSKLVQYPTFEKMKYNKENLLNPSFIAYNIKNEKAVKATLLLP